MAHEDYKALGLPLYEDIVRAFQETDHYNICHRTSEEWTDGAEWVRRIAVDAIKAKEKAMIEKACEWLRNELPAYLGLFTSHFQDDDDVEQVVVKACINAQIYDDLKNVMEG